MANKVNILFEADISKGTAAIKAFGGSVKNTFSDVSKYVDAATRHFGFFSTAVTAFTTGTVLKKLFSPKDYMPLHDSLLMMGVNLRKNVRELENFKNKLASLAGEEGEDIEQVFRLASKLSVAYKEDDILKIMKASAKVSDAMEQDLNVSTERVQQLMKIYRKTPEEAEAIADALIASRLDLETLDLMLQKGVLAGGTSKSYKELLAFFAGLKKAGLDSSRVIMRFEGAISALFEKSDKLKLLGIDVFKTDASGKKTRKNTIELLNDLDPVLKKLSKTIGEDKLTEGLDKLFGEGAGKGILFLITQTDKLKEALQDQNNAAQIAADKNAAANKKWSEQLQKIKGHLASIKTDLSPIYEMGGKPLKFFADSPTTTKVGAYSVAAIATAIGGTVLYKKGKGFFGDIKNEAVGLAKGKAVEAATGVTPVYVTNWPSGGSLLKNPMPDSPVPGVPPGAGKSIGFLRQLSVSGLITGSILGTGYYLSKTSKENWPVEPFDYEKSKALVPHKKIDFAGLSLAPKENWNFKNNININMTIDEKGKVTSDTNDMNTFITLKRTEH